MSQPWFKFYTGDWRSDVRLSRCSLAARGLWIELLCVMSESEDRGALVQDGSLFTEQEIATLGRCSLKEARRLLAELEMRGVFSRDEAGVIYSRRMRKDAAKALEDKKNGSKGGNPALKVSDNGGVNPQLKAQIPESREDTRNQDSTSLNLLPVSRKKPAAGEKHGRRKRNEYPEAFLALWRDYPTTPVMGKLEAFEVWRKLPDDEREAAHAAIPAYKAFLRGKPDHSVIHLCRFLSKRRSEGLLEAETKIAAGPSVFVTVTSPQWKAWDRHYRRTKGKSPPTNKDGGWHFESEWPPEEADHAADVSGDVGARAAGANGSSAGAGREISAGGP